MIARPPVLSFTRESATQKVHREEGITTGATADCAACTVVRRLNTIL